jgi:hypothetical protein
MLANLGAAEVGLPLLGGAASATEKTARVNIIPQAQEEVKRRGRKSNLLKSSRTRGPGGAPLRPVPGVRPARAECRAVRDSTLVA